MGYGQQAIAEFVKNLQEFKNGTGAENELSSENATLTSNDFRVLDAEREGGGLLKKMKEDRPHRGPSAPGRYRGHKRRPSVLSHTLEGTPPLIHKRLVPTVTAHEHGVSPMLPTGGFP